jgi:hypothetical protein
MGSSRHRSLSRSPGGGRWKPWHVRPTGGGVDRRVGIIHGQVYDRQGPRAERRSVLFLFAVGVADAVRLEHHFIPEQDRFAHVGVFLLVDM